MKTLRAIFLFTAILAVSAGVGVGVSPVADAQETAAPRLMETHRDWQVYQYRNGDTHLCYVHAVPKSKSPRNVERGQVFFTVTHRSGGVRNEISLRAGYPFNETSKPFVEVDGRRFAFYTGVEEGAFTGAAEDEERAHWAWVRAPEEEAQLVDAMKQGNEMVVKGRSQRGTVTTDRYSLLGFTKAMEHIDGLCS